MVADVLWQAAVEAAVGLQLRNEFPGKKGEKNSAQLKEEKKMGLVHFNQ